MSLKYLLWVIRFSFTAPPPCNLTCVETVMLAGHMELYFSQGLRVICLRLLWFVIHLWCVDDEGNSIDSFLQIIPVSLRNSKEVSSQWTTPNLKVQHFTFIGCDVTFICSSDQFSCYTEQRSKHHLTLRVILLTSLSPRFAPVSPDHMFDSCLTSLQIMKPYDQLDTKGLCKFCFKFYHVTLAQTQAGWLCGISLLPEVIALNFMNTTVAEVLLMLFWRPCRAEALKTGPAASWINIWPWRNLKDRGNKNARRGSFQIWTESVLQPHSVVGIDCRDVMWSHGWGLWTNVGQTKTLQYRLFWPINCYVIQYYIILGSQFFLKLFFCYLRSRWRRKVKDLLQGPFIANEKQQAGIVMICVHILDRLVDLVGKIVKSITLAGFLIRMMKIKNRIIKHKQFIRGGHSSGAVPLQKNTNSPAQETFSTPCHIQCEHV